MALLVPCTPGPIAVVADLLSQSPVSHIQGSILSGMVCITTFGVPSLSKAGSVITAKSSRQLQELSEIGAGRWGAAVGQECEVETALR